MEPLHERLGEIAARTLVIVGADDPARARAEAVATAIPGARLAIVPGAGHGPHLEAPAAFNRLVLDFVSEEHPA
jgi:pimeloyl-ACP methyl ester carboxylesterase